jgi:hypothetical protein
MKTLRSSLALAFLLATAAAQDARLTVLHGVPGLPAAVQVFANGNALFSFDYGEQRGPLSLPAGNYALEVRLNGAPILTASANVAAGLDYAVIANLDATGTPRLSVFGNGLQAQSLPESRLYVRHTAQAPAVDVILAQNGVDVATIPNLSNGGEAVANVAPGRYAVRLAVAGTPTIAFGPADVVFENGLGYGIFATGVALTPSFRLQQQRVPLAARVNVVHGIPGLPAPVTVRANGASLFAFDFGDVRGPLVVPPNTYLFDVLLNGSPVLSRTDTVQRGDDVTIVAHLDAAGSPQLSTFANDVGATANLTARVTVRHLAQAPAVDVDVTNVGQPLATIPNLSNGQQATAALPIGNLAVGLRAAGTPTTVFGPVGFRPVDGTAYQFLAIGSLTGGTFQVKVLQRDLNPAVPGRINTTLVGWNCGPSIQSVPSSFDYGQPFELLAVGAQIGAMAIANFGDSITAVNGAPLPLALAPFGASGCFLNSNVITSLSTVVDAQGIARFAFTVPISLFGQLQPSYFQIGSMSNANPLGYVTTEAIEIR